MFQKRLDEMGGLCFAEEGASSVESCEAYVISPACQLLSVADSVELLGERRMRGP